MITITQAAALLGVSPARLRVLCRDGRIPGAKRVGAVWLLPDRPKVKPASAGPPLKLPTA